MAAAYTTSTNTIYNNGKHRIRRTLTMIVSKYQLTVVGKSKKGINIINRTKTARRGSPCISGSNTFCNIITMTGKLSTCNPRVKKRPSTAAHKKTKHRKTSGVSTVQEKCINWINSIRCCSYLPPIQHFRGCYSVRCIIFNWT